MALHNSPVTEMWPKENDMLFSFDEKKTMTATEILL